MLFRHQLAAQRIDQVHTAARRAGVGDVVGLRLGRGTAALDVQASNGAAEDEVKHPLLMRAAGAACLDSNQVRIVPCGLVRLGSAAAGVKPPARSPRSSVRDRDVAEMRHWHPLGLPFDAQRHADKMKCPRARALHPNHIKSYHRLWADLAQDHRVGERPRGVGHDIEAAIGAALAGVRFDAFRERAARDCDVEREWSGERWCPSRARAQLRRLRCGNSRNRPNLLRQQAADTLREFVPRARLAQDRVGARAVRLRPRIHCASANSVSGPALSRSMMVASMPTLDLKSSRALSELAASSTVRPQSRRLRRHQHADQHLGPTASTARAAFFASWLRSGYPAWPSWPENVSISALFLRPRSG